MTIDLHAHSTASDGTGPPAQVMREAAEADLQVVALTDHDTTAGWAEAATAAEGLGLTLVRGIEISCSREGLSIHLLGYLPDPDHPDLADELRHARESRETRLDRMVARMEADGIPITVEAVRRQVQPGATVGRPHIADALLEVGVVSHRDEAFERFLRNSSPYYVSHYAPDPVRGVEVVLAAGGVPVIAHPFAEQRGRTADDALVEEMAAAGLAGVEAWHPEMTPGAERHAADLAAGLGLLVTGSSDYHGSGKVNRLGERTTAPEVLEAIVATASGSSLLSPP